MSHVSRSRGRTAFIAVAFLGVSLVLTGCTADSATQPIGDQDSPSFEGPWASNFEEIYRSSQSDFVKGVLRDSTITDQEILEMQGRYRECLDAFSYEVEFDQSGAVQYSFPTQEDNAVIEGKLADCANQSGYGELAALAQFISRNPENLDMHTIVASCMVKEGSMPASFGADELRSDMANQDFPYAPGSSEYNAYVKCTADPLGLRE